MSIFIDGFFGKRLYAMSPAIRFEARLPIELCLVCSMLQTFLSSPLTVSTSALFLSSSLSCRFMSEFDNKPEALSVHIERTRQLEPF